MDGYKSEEAIANAVTGALELDSACRGENASMLFRFLRYSLWQSADFAIGYVRVLYPKIADQLTEIPAIESDQGDTRVEWPDVHVYLRATNVPQGEQAIVAQTREGAKVDLEMHRQLLDIYTEHLGFLKDSSDIPAFNSETAPAFCEMREDLWQFLRSIDPALAELRRVPYPR